MATPKQSELTPDSMNMLRTFASANYQAATFDIEDVAGLQRLGQIILSDDPAGLPNEFLKQLIGLIAKQQIENMRTYRNKFEIFTKGTMPFGESIQHLYTNPARSLQFFDQSDSLFSTHKPDVKVQYTSRNRTDVYPVTFSEDQLQTAFLSFENLNGLYNSTVNSLYSGDEIDRFNLTKLLWASEIGADRVYRVYVDDLSVSGGAAKLQEAIATHSGLMTYATSQYNSYQKYAGGSPVMTWTPKDFQILVLREDAATAVNMQYLATVFNLSYGELQAMTITTNDFGPATNCYALLMDISWTQIHKYLFKMTNFYNSRRLKWEYYLHDWEGYNTLLFSNVIAFMAPGDPTYTDVSIFPTNPTIERGDHFAFNAIVDGENAPNQAVTWTATGAQDAATKIDANGILWVSDTETASLITVTATSVGDPTQTATANATIIRSNN